MINKIQDNQIIFNKRSNIFLTKIIIIRVVKLNNNSWSIMSKDFQAEYLNKSLQQSLKHDPYIYLTPQLRQFFDQQHEKFFSFLVYSYLLSEVLLAPLQTVVASLQLSVSKHKNLYQSQQAKTKQLAKINTELTVQQRRRFQLMLRAGGKTIPYTAPVYGGYRQTFNGLKSQGFRAFYKGLLFRLIPEYLCFYPMSTRRQIYDNQTIQKGELQYHAKTFSLYLLLNILSNPLNMMQNRYIIQNNIPQFKIIRKPIKSLMKTATQKQAYRALSYHLFNSLVGYGIRIPLYSSLLSNKQPSLINYGIYFLGQLLVYPFNTAFRRIQCQSQRLPGMIPTRYSNLYHALKVIGFEQGAKGLWRGFSLYTLQNAIRLGFLSLLVKGQKILH